MSFKEQLEKIKDNWFLLVLAIIIVMIMLFTMSGLGSISRGYSSTNYAMEVSSDSMSAYVGSPSYYGYNQPAGPSTFSPEQIYRQVIKNSNMGLEIKVGKFQETDTQLKSYISSKGAFILKENINTNTANNKYIYTGSYTIKVKVSDYDSVISQLKTLGKVTSLNEGEDDVTGKYTNNKLELEVEKERLERFQEMYAQATKMEDKLNLNDRIFNQERTIAYLEDSLKSIEERVDYSTINLTIREKSDYIGIAFIKLATLVKAFVSSTNALLQFIAGILPWALVAGVVYFIVVAIKKRNKSKESLSQKKK